MSLQIKRSFFSDKSTLILREMLHDPGREWKVRDFAEYLKDLLERRGKAI